MSKGFQKFLASFAVQVPTSIAFWFFVGYPGAFSFDWLMKLCGYLTVLLAGLIIASLFVHIDEEPDGEPVEVDTDGVILDGHTRTKVAKELGL